MQERLCNPHTLAHSPEEGADGIVHPVQKVHLLQTFPDSAVPLHAVFETLKQRTVIQEIVC